MPRILIIDTEESIRETLDVFAEMLAYKATLAINPASCDVYSPSFCECSKECACTEILLIDQNMPGMTGLELIQRQHEFGCKIAAKSKVVMSGVLTVEERQLATELGCFVMQKPVSFEVLEQILNTIEEQGQELEAAG